MTPTPDTTARTETAETVTVPREVTPGMIAAFAACAEKAGTTDADCFRAMIAAAPALSPQHPVGVREALEAIDNPDPIAPHRTENQRLHSLADAVRATLSHPPAKDAPGAVKVKALNDDDFPKEIYVQHPSDADFDGQRWSLHDDFDGQHKAVRYVRADLEPSPPLPEADVEVVARVDAMFDAFLTRYKSYNGHVSTDELADYLADARDAARSALVSALRERDEAVDAMTVATGRWQTESAAREKAEQVAAGLRERILSPDFIKEVAQEYLSHRGERPWRILRGGQELWEAHTDAIKSGLVSALRASTEEGKTATPSVAEGAVAQKVEPNQEACPNCGRPKARNVHDVLAGHCPKWWAITDKDADADCNRVAATPSVKEEEAGR